EHLVFPNRFLAEAWRVLRPKGRLLIVAPDFLFLPMASERIGLSYGSGSVKLMSGRVVDAFLTAFDTRIRLRRWHRQRERRLKAGEFWFPILTAPRCLAEPSLGFVPDCDAVYPACPEEIVNYMSQFISYDRHEIFHRSGCAFGLLVQKR